MPTPAIAANAYAALAKIGNETANIGAGAGAGAGAGGAAGAGPSFSNVLKDVTIQEFNYMTRADMKKQM